MRLYGQEFIKVNYHFAKLVAIGSVVVEMKQFQFVTWSYKTTWSKGHVIL